MVRSTKIDATIITVIALAAMSRLIPHWPNFTPVMAIALVAGAALSRRSLTLIVPVAAMILSDAALGLVMGWEYAFHSTQWAVYGSVAAIALMGRLFASSSAIQTTLVGGTIAGVGFFLVTNFAVWLAGGLYPMTLEGLVMSYTAGLAFYRDGGNFLLNGVLSTVFYASVAFLLIHSIIALQSRRLA